jgi:V/A-type H+-transporting ATPase subunit D
MAEIIEGVHPTRMELLEINNKIKLATKGHKLLKEKRDSLIMEFFGVVDKSREDRGNLFKKLEKAYKDLILAEAINSIETIEGISHGMPPRGEISIKKDNIFGVEIPKIELLTAEKSGETPKRYSLIATSSSKVDEAIKEFQEIFLDMLKLVEREETMRRLGEEIKLTKRRVNALEYIMIPRLTNTQKYIRNRLEELERENFFRLKIVKRKKSRAET